MPIKQRYHGFQVTVNRKGALEGYRRIRVQSNGTYEEAEEREKEINRALTKYGKWPVTEQDRPLDKPTRAIVQGSGSLRRAYRLALDTYWKDMRWGETVRTKENLICGWFEREDHPDLDDIDSAILDKFVAWRQSKKITNNTIRKDLAILKKVFDVAYNRVPPLTRHRLAVPHVTVKKLRKWYVKPERIEDMLEFIEIDMDNWHFADFCRSMLYQGPRVEENMRITIDDFVDLEGKTPTLRVPGTKTELSDRSVPIWDFMVPIYKRNIESAKTGGRTLLWPFSVNQLNHLWRDVRGYMGAADEPTATLKALRRTFAWFAKTRGLDVLDIKNILGHSDIQTTEGYLRLFGNPGLELSREKVNGKQGETQKVAKSGSWMTDAIRAYKDAVNPSPTEMALFVKTLKE